MPATVPAVYLTHPVLLSGPETEGGSGTLTVDSATTVPVVILGHVPSVGDYLTAYAVGGRWVSERGTRSGGEGTGTTCEPCTIPNEDLTLSWTNLLSGNGSTSLTYNPSGPIWESGCADEGLMFLLQCTSGSTELRAIYFTSGECPSGDTNYCSNLRSEGQSLTLASSTCSPFSLTFTVTESGCPALYGDGNTQFILTQ